MKKNKRMKSWLLLPAILLAVTLGAALFLISPLFAVMIGLIPNCASSIIISKLYLLGGINFSAALVGLSVNAGLGTLFLIKNEKNKKKALTIMLTLISISLIAGYISLLISYLI